MADHQELLFGESEDTSFYIVIVVYEEVNNKVV